MSRIIFDLVKKSNSEIKTKGLLEVESYRPRLVQIDYVTNKCDVVFLV